MAHKRLESNGRINVDGHRLDGDGRCSAASIDDAMAPRRQWTARRLLNGDERQGMAQSRLDCDCNGDGWRWIANWQLNSYGRRDGSFAVMDGEGRRECNADGL